MGNKIKSLVVRRAERNLKIGSGFGSTFLYSSNIANLQRSGTDNKFYRNFIRLNLSATNPMAVSSLDTQWCWSKNDYRDGVPDWHFKKGPIPRLQLRYAFPPGADEWVQRPVEAYQEGPSEGFPTAPFFSGIADPKLARASAMSKAFKQLRKEQRRLQGLVVLGELRKTIQMLKRPLSSLRSGVNDYFTAVQRRTRGVKRSRVKDVLADTWLEYSFGWVPFLNDVRDAAELAASVVQKQKRATFRTFGEDSHLINLNASQVIGAEYAHLRRITSDTERAFCIVRVGLDCRLDQGYGSTFEYLRRAAGFTFSDFVPAAWELIPWSFLIDYFSNVGDVLEAATTDVTALRWVNVTEVYESERRVDFILDTESTINYFNTHFRAKDFGNVAVIDSREEGLLGCYRSKRRTVSRWSGSLMVPPLRLEIPTSPLKFLNLAALFGRGESIQRSFR